MKKFDIVVLGAGPGGYVAAIKAAQLGKKVGVIEREYLGGVCLNVGCIPSKALLRNAELAHLLRNEAKEFGISFDNLQLDYGAAYKRSRQVSQRLTKGVGFLMKKNNIEVINGEGKLTAPGKILVTLTDGGEEEVQAQDIILATGAQPTVIPGMEPDGTKNPGLQTRHPGREPAKVRCDHWRWSDRDRVCDGLERLRRGSERGGNAPAHSAK
jgi:dihydrolipoamide dehydrogenase (EC 1.8.1.4)